MDPRALLEEETRRRWRTGEDRLRRSISASGVGHLSLTVGARLAGGRPRPTLSVSSAAILQRLGEHRLHGFAPWIAIELFSASTELRLAPGPEGATLRSGRSELTLISFRSIRVEPRTRQASLEDTLGWGFHARYEHLPTRAAPHAARLGLEALLTVDATEQLSRFTTFGLGVEAALLGLPAGATLGPTLTLSQRLHLFGSYVNALRLEAAFRPGLRVGAARWMGEMSDEAGPTLGHTLDLVVSASFRTGPLALRPGLGLAWSGAGAAPQQAPTLSLTLAVERL